MTPNAHLAHVASLGATVHAQMPTGRRDCRLPEPLVQGLVEHGLFRLWIPQRYGGFELSLTAALQVYEAAARLDGSFGWAVMIGSGGGLFAAYLESETAGALFAPRAAVVAGSGMPTGTAERVPGGYRATGRWRYASGADYATVFTANCRITEHGNPVRSGAEPLVRAMSFHPKDVIIHRTWDTVGLRATGSHDIEVGNTFVPERATFSVITDQPLEPGRLYRLPFGTLTELPVCAVALGVAQHALDEFESLARTKPAPGLAGPLEHLDVVRHTLAATHATIDDARRKLYEQAATAWDATQAGRRPEQQTVDGCTAVSIAVVRSLVAAITDLVPLAGMNALHVGDPFAIAWRDLEAVAAHYSVSPISSPSRRG